MPRLYVGAMIGGAAAIFLQTDTRVADRSATFQHGNLSRGVCPVAGYSHTLLSAVGVPHAFDYYLCDYKLTAAHAQDLDLVQVVGGGLFSSEDEFHVQALRIFVMPPETSPS